MLYIFCNQNMQFIYFLCYYFDFPDEKVKFIMKNFESANLYELNA